MKGISKKLEEIFSAITFAEAGEHETAREMMKNLEPPGGGSSDPAEGVHNARDVFEKTGSGVSEPELGI